MNTSQEAGASRRGDQQQPVMDGDRTTPGGIWVFRDKDVHRCPKPAYAAEATVGDIWECNECHQQWKVVNSKNSWLDWVKHSAQALP